MTDREILNFIAENDTLSILQLATKSGLCRNAIRRVIRKYHLTQVWEQRKPGVRFIESADETQSKVTKGPVTKEHHETRTASH